MTPSSGTTTVSVVVVDDDDAVRELICTLVRREPDLDLAGDAINGLEAVELAADYHPDVVILDLMMPVMDGLEALPRIRDVSPDTKVVMFTAVSDRRQELLDAGADACVIKGDSWGEIVSAIVRLVPRR